MTNPNDPAHPQHGWSKDPEMIERMKSQAGLTKREYFTAMAMQMVMHFYKDTDDDTFPHMATDSVRMADALIAELNKDPK